MVPDSAAGDVTDGATAGVTVSAVEKVRAKRVLRTTGQERDGLVSTNGYFYLPCQKISVVN